MAYQRILVIHPNRANAKLLRNGLEAQGKQVKSIYAGIDSVPAFERFQPDAVVVDESLRDLPVEAVVAAFRQMNADIYIFLCGHADTDELRSKCQNLAVTGCITPPLGKVDWEKAMAMVVSSDGDDEDRKEDQTCAYYVDEAEWQEFPLLASHETREAKSFNKGESYQIAGNLKITGNIRNIASLEVSGSLMIEGDVINCKIHCGQNLKVQGKMDQCQQGVFVLGDVDVASLAKSLVVSGGNLIIANACRDSDVTVLQRMVGLTQKSKIVGGRVRVGEHLSMAVLGDHHQSLTQIQIAPPLLYEAWQRHKYRLWEVVCRGRPNLPEKRKNLFEKQATNPKFYQLLGEILTDKMYPGVDISIGEKDEFVFELLDKPVRIGLGRKNRYIFGVCIRKRQAHPKSKGPQKTTASLD